MSWWSTIRRVVRWLLPVNILLAGAAYACLQHPIMRVQELEVTYEDGRCADSSLHQRVADMVFAHEDSNLLQVDTRAIADSILACDPDLIWADVSLRPPHSVRVLLKRSEPLAWWAAPTLQPVDCRGQILKADSLDGFKSLPILSRANFLEKNLDRMYSIDLYQQLLRHDQRWGQVISQVGCLADTGWCLILNAGAERVLLGWDISDAKLNRLVRFLESTPPSEWQGAQIDVRFSERVIITPAKARMSRRTH